MGSVDLYPPSQPSGMALAYSSVTANQAGITTTSVDLTSLTVTVTVPAGRRIRVTGKADFAQTVATVSVVELRIMEGATQLQRGKLGDPDPQSESAYADVILTPSAGTHTYKLMAVTDAGTVSMVAATDLPAFILVEDITGTIYPAGTLVTAGIIASEGWTTYSPTLTQSGAVTNTTLYAKYMKLGRTVHVNVVFQVTGTGSASNNVLIGLPFATAYTPGFNMVIGSGYIGDNSAATNYTGALALASTTTVGIIDDGGAGFLGSTGFTAALANADAVSMMATYEAVS